MNATCLIFRTILLGLLIHSVGQAQTATPPRVSYFNQFQRFETERNIDSAFYNAQMLANQNEALANFLIHDSFAQAFRKEADTTRRRAFAEQLMERLNTGSIPLQRVVYSLKRWVEARRNVADTARIRRIVNGVMTAQDRSPETNGNRIDRYALLIYQLLRPLPTYRALADTLLAHTQQRIEHANNGVFYQADPQDRNRLTNRAYYRFLAACIESWKADEAHQRSDLAAARQHYKLAAALGPDEHDRLVKSAFFYESVMLLGSEKVDFYTPYVAFLLKQGSPRDTVIHLLTERALADPGTLSGLKTYYEQAGSPGGDFKPYWRAQLNARLKPAEPFQLTGLDKTVFDYQQHKGKWVLIDFWGTWCSPCVAELPDMQKLYEQIKNRTDIVVMTVACREANEQTVRDFLGRMNYTFPVAMADDKIEKQFRVGEYPTKVLITPQGNRMKIPFNTNWAERIKIYTENE